MNRLVAMSVKNGTRSEMRQHDGVGARLTFTHPRRPHLAHLANGVDLAAVEAAAESRTD